MNYVIRKVKFFTQNIVDRVYGRKIDIVGWIGYILITILAAYVVIETLSILKHPILKSTHSSIFYTTMIAAPMVIFFLTMAGDFFKKPSRRVQQFVLVVASTSAFTFAYIAQILNTGFVNMIINIKNIEVIPKSLLEGNIRMVSFFIPLATILPIIVLTIKLILDKDIRKDLIEYEVELLLPNTHKMDDTTIDFKICENIENGEDCVVPEKVAFEHIFLQGGTGSGKTSTYIRPFLGQIFYKKAYLNEMQKKLAFEALEKGLAYITIPVTNKYLNDNFTMDLIKPKAGFESEYKEKFKKFILGVRDREETLINKSIESGELSFEKPKGSSFCEIKISIYNHDMIFAEKKVKLTADTIVGQISVHDKFKPITLIDDYYKDEEKSFSSITDNENKIIMRFPKLPEGYSYQVVVKEKESGDIIYKNLGATIVAPDGGLPSDTIKIAQEFNIKVHKIDPVMSEIEKGGIAKFNPLLGGSPEKTGDIISSILVSMEQTNGSQGNPYFINASVRAVRNITILLKVMYPIMYKSNPTLFDILNILNDFNSVVPMVEEMKKHQNLKSKWLSVINYFETSFYPPPVDDKGKSISGATIGSQRKKTEEAIGGIINQLDNFLGREEIKYILCNREESLNLSEVLEKGECIAIATRQNDLGERLGRAFALFFILSLQNAVLSRYSEDENPEIPHYLVIDEFPFYINDSTKVFFTFARKYKCSVTVAIQNMAQLREVSDVFREVVFTNTSTKLLLPKSNVEDRKYWSEFFGITEGFEIKTGVNQGALMSERPNYSESKQGTMSEKARITEQDINDLNFKQAFYCYTDSKGRQKVGKGTTDFLKITDDMKIEKGYFDFEKFNTETIEQYKARMKAKENINKEQDSIVKDVFDSSDVYNEGKFDSIGENTSENIGNIDIDSIELDLENDNEVQCEDTEVVKNTQHNKKLDLNDKIILDEKIDDKHSPYNNVNEYESNPEAHLNKEFDLEVEGAKR